MKYTTLKQLSAAIKSLKESGFEVIKQNHLLNSRNCYWVDGRILTDYQVLDVASHGYLPGSEEQQV